MRRVSAHGRELHFLRSTATARVGSACSSVARVHPVVTCRLSWTRAPCGDLVSGGTVETKPRLELLEHDDPRLCCLHGIAAFLVSRDQPTRSWGRRIRRRHQSGVLRRMMGRMLTPGLDRSGSNLPGCGMQRLWSPRHMTSCCPPRCPGLLPGPSHRCHTPGKDI